MLQVIPPKEWVARASGYEDIDLIIPAPIEQEGLSGCKGTVKVLNVAKKSMTVREYRELANSSKYVDER
jgi:jumonji domain-containing protein 2